MSCSEVERVISSLTNSSAGWDEIVFKKIMYNCILKCMDANHVFYEHKYGFRQKHSTQQAVITLVDKITNYLDKGDIIISVFLYLKKHLILLTIIY